MPDPQLSHSVGFLVLVVRVGRNIHSVPPLVIKEQRGAGATMEHISGRVHAVTFEVASVEWKWARRLPGGSPGSGAHDIRRMIDGGPSLAAVWLQFQ